MGTPINFIAAFITGASPRCIHFDGNSANCSCNVAARSPAALIRRADPVGGAWLVCGRRAGKSFVLALIAVYLAAFRSYVQYLGRPAERATVRVIATDRRQARVIFRFIRGLIETLIDSPRRRVFTQPKTSKRTLAGSLYNQPLPVPALGADGGALHSAGAAVCSARRVRLCGEPENC